MIEQKLKATITGDSKGLNDALNASIDNLNRLDEEGKNAGRNTARAVDDAAGAFRRAGDAAADAADKSRAWGKINEKGGEYLSRAFSAISGTITKRIEEVTAAAQDLGVSAGTFHTLEDAAYKSGEKVSTVTEAFKNLQKQSKAALSGDAGAVDAFKRLGISIDELQNQTPEQIFNTVCNAVNILGDALDDSTGLAAKTKLLGENFKDLTKFTEEYATAAENAEGSPISDASIEASRAMAEAMKNLSDTLVQICQNTGFIAYLNDVCNSINEIAQARQILSKNDVQNKDSWWQNALSYMPSMDDGFLSKAILSAFPLLGVMAEGVDALRDAGVIDKGYKTEAATPEELQHARQRTQQRTQQREYRQQQAENAKREAEQKQNAEQQAKQQLADAKEYAAYYKSAENTAKAQLSEAEKTLDNAERRLTAADKQVEALEQAAEAEKEAARLAKRTNAVSKADNKLAQYNFTPKSRKQYRREQLDSAIAQKMELRAAGAKVQFTKEERKRIKRRQRAEDELEEAQRDLARFQRRQKKKLEQQKAEAMESAKREQKDAQQARNIAAKNQTEIAQKTQLVVDATNQANSYLQQMTKQLENLSKNSFIVK